MKNINSKVMELNGEVARLSAKLGFLDKGTKKYDKVYNQLQPLIEEKMKLEQVLEREAKFAKEQEEIEREKERRFLDDVDFNYRNMIISTTPTLEGYIIESYITIESAEVVVGTSVFKDFFADMSDFLGGRANGYENSLSQAKRQAFDILKYKCAQLGGNAIVGIDVDYMDIGNKAMMGVVVGGTVVKVKKVPDKD